MEPFTQEPGQIATTSSPEAKILISSCIAGLPYKFDGKARSIESLIALVKSGVAVHFCAEHLGAGMAIPRRPAEIEQGMTAADVLAGNARIFTDEGEDLTEGFLIGARQTLEFCLEHNVQVAILKDRSPSCGSKTVYDGQFNGERIPGRGVVAELLTQNGIRVISDEDFENDPYIRELLQ